MRIRMCVLSILVLVLALALMCCACTEEQVDKTPEVVGVKVFETDLYSILLPEDMTAEEGEEGVVTLSSEEHKVGGILPIEYAETGQLRIETILDKECQEAFELFLNRIAPMIAPEGYTSHMFSSDLTADFCLSIVPLSDSDDMESEQPEMIHYFFVHENVIYDLFLIKDMISPVEEKILLDSFSS